MLAGARESFIKTFFISEIDFACLELTCNVGFFQWWFDHAEQNGLCVQLFFLPETGYFDHAHFCT